MKHEKYHYRLVEDIQQTAESRGAFLPLQTDYQPLFQPLKIGDKVAANRIAFQPMEGTDGLEVDLTEPLRLIGELKEQFNIPLLNITMGNPYKNPMATAPMTMAITSRRSTPSRAWAA